MVIIGWSVGAIMDKTKKPWAISWFHSTGLCQGASVGFLPGTEPQAALLVDHCRWTGTLGWLKSG